jgi:hypothetical protein
LVQPKDNTIVSPDVPDPTASQTHVDTPTVQERRSSPLDLPDIVVPDPSAEQREWTEVDRQLTTFIGNRQMVK